MYRGVLLALAFFVSVTLSSFAQTITIDGVSDRGTFTDVAAFRVQTNAGFTYLATLNGVPIPVGVTNRITRMDYYDLVVSRTNSSDNSVTNVLVRFIVLSSQRGSPELGLIQWVPLPPIPSTIAEVSGAQLDLMAPQTYPAGLDIPVIARVENGDGSARRVNGWVSAPGYEASAFRLLRGVGFGLLPPSTAGTNFSYQGRLQSLQNVKQVTIESNTTWTTVSGILGDTTWPSGSRIHVTANLTIPAGNTLTIGEGTVVRLNAGVNITNSGHTVINGTPAEPVVFTATNRVAPEQRAGAWGGWFMRGTASQLIANNAIMTGSGAAGSISFSPGSSHRSEQPLLFMHNCTVRMTNCALINNAGQIGNGYFANVTLERCIWQRAITVGEYEGCTNIIRNSALIEFPSVDGVYSAAIADADYDGYYAIRGTNFFANSLFGFAKDDAIDSGSGGPGTFTVSNCWIESALHEALAWSGEGRRTWTYDSVLMNCGQGLECGWSTTNATSLVSPIVFGSNILSTANSIGTRFGDNYEGTSGLGNKAGFLTVTNSFLLYNYRDIFGRPWDNTWNWRTNNMDIRNNFVTQPNTNHLLNTLWNPAADGAKLARFMSTPPDAPVGIGLALWDPLKISDLTNGVPVRLSSFTTNSVTVDYSIETPSSSLLSGTLTFVAGETVKRIFANPSLVNGITTWRLALSNPVGGEITGTRAAYLLPAAPQTNNATMFVGSNAVWKYFDQTNDLGTAWTALDYDDSGWLSGAAQLGFGETDQATTIASNRQTTTYFRRQFTVANPAAFGNISLWLLRDDAGVVFINTNEVYRSPNLPPPPTVITNRTLAPTTGENDIDTATILATNLVAGTNIVAVEIHQQAITSSDVSFALSLTGNPISGSPSVSSLRFGNQLVIYWAASGFVLEQADQVTGPWTYVSSESPVTIAFTGAQEFFRLRKP
jgi:hypothetical protein